jgi:hypothetical protein
MRRAEHVVCMGRGEVHTSLRRGNMREIDHLEDLTIDGRVILKCLFKKWEVLHKTDYSGSG